MRTIKCALTIFECRDGAHEVRAGGQNKDTPHFKSAVFCWIFNIFTGSIIMVLKITKFFPLSNAPAFQILCSVRIHRGDFRLKYKQDYDIIHAKELNMDNENLEIKSALQTIELLKQYKSAKNQTEKDAILKQIEIRADFNLFGGYYIC